MSWRLILQAVLILVSPLSAASPGRADDGGVLFRSKFRLAAMGLSGDGKLAAIADGDKSVQLVDLAGGKELRAIPAAAHALAISADGKVLAAGDAGVTLFDAETGRQITTLATDQKEIRSLGFSRDGKRLAIGSPRGGARVWDLTAKRELAAFDLGHWGVTNVALTPDGKILIAAGNAMINLPPPGLPVTMKFVAWNVESKKPLFSGPWPTPGGPLLLSPDGKTLAVAAEGGLDLWDVTAGKIRASLRGHPGFPQAAAFSADGKLVATGCEQGIIRIWETGSGHAMAFTRKTAGPVRGLAFSGGKSLVSFEAANGETVVRTWDATDDTSHYLYMPLPNECFALGVSADGAKLFAATDAGVSRWNLKTGQQLLPLTEHKCGLDGAAFSADGKTVATLDRSSELRLWDVDRGKVRLNRPKTGKFAAAFNADASLLAVADYNEVVALNTADAKPRFNLVGHRKQVTGIAFSPDGKTIVTVGQDQDVRWWDAATGKPQATELHGSSLACVAISPDGKLVASGAEDGTVKVWDLKTREIVANLEGHEKTVRCLAFSPDSKSLATGSADGACKIWDIGEQKARITIASAGGPTALAFMPDGKTLLTAGASKTVHLWDPGTGAEKLKP